MKAYPLGGGGGVFRRRIGADVRLGSRLEIELFARANVPRWCP